MWFVVWIPVVAAVLVPVMLLAWIARGRHSRAELAVVGAGTAAYLAACAAAVVLLALPWYTPLVFGVLLGVAAAVGWRRAGSDSAAARRWPRAGLAARIAFAAVSVGLAWYAWGGRRAPEGAVDLAFPLERGTWQVVNGGAHALVNAHFMTLAPRYARWRGQSHGVDLVKLGPGGLRARGVLPSDVARYATTGEPVRAPCAGDVIVSVDGRPDMRPPEPDRTYLPGNHVVLQCGEYWVVLAHFRRGSVLVQGGHAVALGQPLGRVGNSGNSGEPHLHIHVQRRGTMEQPLAGAPVPLLLEGRFPARNQRFVRR